MRTGGRRRGQKNPKIMRTSYVELWMVPFGMRRVEDAGEEVEELGTEAARLLDTLRKNIIYD